MQVFHATAVGEQFTYLRLGDDAYLTDIDQQKVLFLFCKSEHGYDLNVYKVDQDMAFAGRNTKELEHFSKLFKEIHLTQSRERQSQ